MTFYPPDCGAYYPGAATEQACQLYGKADPNPETLQQVCQVATPRYRWPYPQDWIVSNIHLNKQAGQLYVTGENLNRPLGNGRFEVFIWRHWLGNPLNWRYNLTNATYT